MNGLLKQLHDTSETFTAPLALPKGLPPVIPFSPEMLPLGIREHTMDTAYRLQAAPEYCAVVALTCLSAVLGRKVLIGPKQYDDWTVTANLWGALIGGPSSMKSPVLKAMRFPLESIEQELRDQHAATLARYNNEAEICDMERQAAKQRAKKKAKDGDRSGALAELEKVDIFEEPSSSSPRLIVNDATVEALGEKLNENPNGLLLFRDELTGWLSKMQREEYASDRAFYLECWNGDGRYTYDRIGRGTVAIEHCTLSIIGGIQPSKIAPIVRGATTGSDDDGLVQRFQLSVWPDPNPKWKWVDQAPCKQSKEKYRQAFYALHNLHFETEDDEPPIWKFSDEAQPIFIEWMEELHSTVKKGDLSPVMESHLLKMPQTICSLALLFALIEGEQDEIGHDSTCRALAWAKFLTSHAERLYSAVTCSHVAGAILIHKRRDKLPNPFTARHVHRKQWTGLTSSEDVKEAIQLLEEHKYVNPITTTADTGRPTIFFYWHTSMAPKEAA
ncbi:YfjI family protein [Vreelandella indica]|uniref:YfjI family protein n=1 Tax=Vreelandella indica TaxID=3126500 RepID=UPI00300DFC44